MSYPARAEGLVNSINEEMLPKYKYFKLHDPAAHEYNNSLEYRRDLVKRQITLRKDNINTLNLETQKNTRKNSKSTLHQNNSTK